VTPQSPSSTPADAAPAATHAPDATEAKPPPGASTRRARARAYYELTKPGIAGFVMITAGVAYYVGAGGRAAFLPVFHTLFGTVVATAGALALNQYLERGVDARMRRTRKRPLPSGRLHPMEALVFGAILVVGGVLHLGLTVGTLPALFTLASAVAYNFIYTPLKPRSYAATFAGAFPGAFPALIGWTAATGSVDLGGMILFGIAFLWQLPHVLALAWLLREDYQRAGFLLTPPADDNGRVIGNQMILYSTVLIPASLAPTLVGLTGWIYFAGALLLGSVVLAWAIQARRSMSNASVRKVFLGSLAYQPLLLGLMLVDTVRI
jgi:protoheme IX farnesyltransferase